MSFQAYRWALYDAPHLLTDKGLPDSTARAVLAVLGEHADEKGKNSFPSPLRIRYATGFDVRTIERAIRRLESAKLIVRDGVTRTGAPRWYLSLEIVRPDGEWEQMVIEWNGERRAESTKRNARRTKKDRHDPIDFDDVRHAESGCPAFSVPASGTQNPDVRHAESRRPITSPLEESENRPRTVSGGTLPPDPLRLEDPSGLRKDENSLSEQPTESQDQESDHRPRASERADPGVHDSTCAKGFVLVNGKIQHCPECHPNVIQFPRTA